MFVYARQTQDTSKNADGAIFLHDTRLLLTSIVVCCIIQCLLRSFLYDTRLNFYSEW